MVLEISHQLERIRRDNFNDEVLVQAHLDGAQHLDQVERMARRNSDTQPMERVVLGFLSFMHGPPKCLDALSGVRDERAPRPGSDHTTVSTLEEWGLNSTFNFLELLTQGRFAHPQALGGLSHIALFMQGNDQFEIADSELAFRHGASPSAHTNPCASPRQAGRPHHWSMIPPGNDGHVKSVFYNPQPYLLHFDTLIAI
jgi:hypothetical protein